MGITANDKIGNLLTEHPELYDVFLAKGFKAGSAAELTEILGKDTMLQTVLKVKNINSELFLSAANERIDKGTPLESITYNLFDPKLPMNLLVKTACPVSELFKQKLSEYLAEHKMATGKTVNTFIVDGCSVPHDYNNFWEQPDIDSLPDIIMSMSFDEIFDKRFIDKYVKTGYFENVLKTPTQDFTAPDFMDDSFTLHAGLVMMLLIDEDKLGALPRPKKWADLLKPIYKDKIVGFGNDALGIFEYPLYYVYKEFGMEGIKTLAENTKSICHAAKMVKLAGSNHKDAEAIYILPLTFATLCKNKNTSFVFPEDGAWIVPMSILVKKDKVKELDFVIDFILNEYGQMCADIDAVSFSPGVTNKIDRNIRLEWLGWII
jgi:ABC-type Fe3+ transport system substrate-binding protein